MRNNKDKDEILLIILRIENKLKVIFKNIINKAHNINNGHLTKIRSLHPHNRTPSLLEVNNKIISHVRTGAYSPGRYCEP